MSKEKMLFYLICFFALSIILKWLLAVAGFIGWFSLFSYRNYRETIWLLSILFAAIFTARVYRK